MIQKIQNLESQIDSHPILYHNARVVSNMIPKQTEHYLDTRCKLINLFLSSKNSTTTNNYENFEKINAINNLELLDLNYKNYNKFHQLYKSDRFQLKNKILKEIFDEIEKYQESQWFLHQQQIQADYWGWDFGGFFCFFSFGSPDLKFGQFTKVFFNKFSYM